MLVVRIGGLGKTKQRRHGRAEIPETFGRNHSLAVPESVQQTDQRRTLPGEIMQVEQLKTADARRLERPLDLLLV